MEGEHFITGSSSPAREAESEAAGRELVISTQPVHSSSASKDSAPTPQASRQGERGNRLEQLPLERKGSCPAPRTLKRRKGTPRRQNVPRAGVEDFIPWVPPISSRPSDWEEEEEEDMMSDLIHNFAARKRKRDASFELVADAIPGVAGGSGWFLSDEGSKVLTIVISGSPEMGLNDQPTLENVALVESMEVFPTLATIQVVYPPKHVASQSNKAKYTWAERGRTLLPDRMFLNSYLPPRCPAPPIEEVTVPWPEGAQEIIDRWRPFNRGESSAGRLHKLYPVMLRMPVAVLARG